MVISGVPQGSILGPLLFLIFINDLDVGIENWILKFADDTKVFSSVNSVEEHSKLQKDLQAIKRWSEEWQILFNVDKCKVMHIGKENQNLSYYMDGKHVNQEKDLGIIITNDLKPSAHCTQNYTKANRMLGMIARTFSTRDQHILLSLYKVLSGRTWSIVRQLGLHTTKRIRTYLRRFSIVLLECFQN